MNSITRLLSLICTIIPMLLFGQNTFEQDYARHKESQCSIDMTRYSIHLQQISVVTGIDQTTIRDTVEQRTHYNGNMVLIESDDVTSFQDNEIQLIIHNNAKEISHFTTGTPVQLANVHQDEKVLSLFSQNSKLEYEDSDKRIYLTEFGDATIKSVNMRFNKNSEQFDQTTVQYNTNDGSQQMVTFNYVQSAHFFKSASKSDFIDSTGSLTGIYKNYNLTHY